MKVVSMVNRIDEIRDITTGTMGDKWELTVMYKDFLNQKLTEPYKIGTIEAHYLNRFIACDLEGNVLEEPKISDYVGKELEFKKSELVERDSIKYQQAKDRILFIVDDFTFIADGDSKDKVLMSLDGTSAYSVFYLKEMIIEDLIKFDLTLTPAGEQMIEL